MKSSSARGCFLGGVVSFFIFMALAAIRNDAPDFGGILVIPLFILFFGAAGTFVGWLVGTPPVLSRPARGDLAVWGKGCLVALGLCAGILLLLVGLGHYATSH